MKTNDIPNVTPITNHYEQRDILGKFFGFEYNNQDGLSDGWRSDPTNQQFTIAQPELKIKHIQFTFDEHVSVDDLEEKVIEAIRNKKYFAVI